MTTSQREQEAAGEVPETGAPDEAAEEAAEDSVLSKETVQEAQALIERMRFSWDHVSACCTC